MSDEQNDLSQPVGAPVLGWVERPRPPQTAIEGRYCRIERLDPERHAADLYAANLADTTGRHWTYLPYGPFSDFTAYRAWIAMNCLGDDPLFHAIVDLPRGRAVGVASYLRISPRDGVIEVGHIHYSPALQRTWAATEAMYLMMRRVFEELGYRRYEWKCNALNAPSCRAAERLGFTFEGVFRQATISKGRNRDTAWYSVIDEEWPALKAAFERWLSPANCDAVGCQRESLRARR